MLPEEQARVIIDEKLTAAGWAVVSRSEFSDSAVGAQTVMEALTKGNREADYMLFLDGKAIGVLEAKRAENSLGLSAAEQAAEYSTGTLPWYQTWTKPLPFLFISNGEKILFKNALDKTAVYEPIKKMLTPKQLVQIAEDFGQKIESEFAKMPAIPAVGPKGLRQCQYDAIRNLESSFKLGRKRALIVLATGSGKTFTACTIAYRLLNYTPAKKVLFLVDRNNLGNQAQGEFGTYKLTETQIAFSDEYVVNRLKKLDDVEKSNVVISTIQRLFATLTGQELIDSDDDEESELDSKDDNEKEVELSDKLLLAPDTFDLIIIDECHRSIYGKWQKVLKYFKTARLVGLTATPTEEAYAFFNKNTVKEYSLEDSIRDGVNVPARVYRVRTAVTENGGTISQGEKLKRVTLLDGTSQKKQQKDAQEYTSGQLDRSVVNPAQIKLVVEEYKKAIYESLYPEREKNWKYIPKTLFFAKTDSHADDIVDAVKLAFGEEFKKQGMELPKEFVQKITCKAGNTNKLINSFRNDKDFRIAVTVTLVATGTDVKPLEILVFMRDLNSSVLYTQMKGRGCRTIEDDKFQLITPNAISKDCFFLFDAVGVTAHEMHIPHIGDNEFKKVLSLKDLMEHLSHGEVSDDNLDLFAGYLSKIQNKSEVEDLAELNQLLSPTILADFIQRLYNALTGKEKFAAHPLPEYNDINDSNSERKTLISAVLINVKARRKILEINKGFLKILEEATDTLLYSGFSLEESKTYTEQFRAYIDEHKDEVEALRILYNNEDAAISYDMLKDLKNKLQKYNPVFTAKNLWDYYNTLSVNGKIEGKVKNLKEDETALLTNLIQLVRFAWQKQDSLYCLQGKFNSLFELYCGQNQRALSDSQKAVLKQIAQYVIQNGCVTNAQLMQFNKPLFLQTAKTFGPDKINFEIQNLAKFLIRAVA